MSVWLIIYLAGMIPFGVALGYTISYRDSRNKREALVLGIVYGLTWPAILAIGGLMVAIECLAEWISEGDPR